MRKTIVCFFLLLSHQAFAGTWADLWARPDQQAARLLSQGHAAQAAKRFDDVDWKSVAQYRAGQYQATINSLQNVDTPIANYNRGNALAHLGQYQQAIKAYEQVLKTEPNNKDAKFNRDLLLKLLKKQPKKNQQQSSKQQTKQNSQQKQSQSKQQQANNKQRKSTPPQSKQHSQQNQQQSKQQQANNKQQPSPQTNKQQPSAASPQNQTQAQKQQAKPTSSKSLTQQQAQQRAAKQWLKRVPDDPGGLLRQKFLRDYLRQQGDNS